MEKAAAGGSPPPHWCQAIAPDSYSELDHPADLFLEIRGATPEQLLEHALFALFDQIVDLSTVRLQTERVLTVEEPGWPEALRHLLAEALALFDGEGFLAGAARVTAGEQTPNRQATRGQATGGRTAGKQVADPPVRISASLWGENLDSSRHSLQAEIKAVTYHRLLVEQVDDGSWRAQVLFDV